MLALGPDGSGRRTLLATLTHCLDEPYRLEVPGLALDFSLDPEFIPQASVVLLLFDLSS